MALSGLAGGEKTGWNSTTGAPIDGMARLAKEWFLPPDGRFTADKGPIELSVGVVDAGETGWGREKGRKRARVEVVNKAGGIKVELVSREIIFFEYSVQRGILADVVRSRWTMIARST
jgi:hypothetical protein